MPGRSVRSWTTGYSSLLAGCLIPVSCYGSGLGHSHPFINKEVSG